MTCISTGPHGMYLAGKALHAHQSFMSLNYAQFTNFLDYANDSQQCIIYSTNNWKKIITFQNQVP